MTPEERAALIVRAKQLAPPVAACVAARLRPDHLLRDATRDELAALVIVLAEAVDRAVLRVVAAAGEDGPVVTDRTMLLRRAHREANRLREKGEPVPLRVGVLENEYQEMVRAARKGAREGRRRAA